jgi:hypothetical protein
LRRAPSSISFNLQDKLGVEIPVFKGRDNIVSSIGGALAEIDTTHTVTNIRVSLEGDNATLFALVEAQHLPKSDHSRNLLLKNFYWVSLERAGGRWAITAFSSAPAKYHRQRAL